MEDGTPSNQSKVVASRVTNSRLLDSQSRFQRAFRR